MKYRFIDDLTSDVMFEAYGKDLKEVFENSARALFSVICQIEKIGKTENKIIEVRGRNPGELMFNWLQELISTVDIDMMFFSEFRIVEINEKYLKAEIYGEESDPSKGGTVVKAVTNYKYLFEKTDKGYKTRVSLDI
ncbi:MAG: archease [Candidatus Aenigmarchaeota archaeon]|nr:archease [Candidatus Aenigmarchaeota archaeon]